jgi:hypothetical protein
MAVDRGALAEELIRTRQQQARIDARLDDIQGRPPTEREMRARVDAQARADPIYREIGMHAPAPLSTESVANYRRRLLEPLIRHDKTWAGMSPYQIPVDALPMAEQDVFASAKKLAVSNDFHPPGKLRERRVKDEAGRETVEYYGDPLTWMRRYMIRSRFVKRIGPKSLNE